MPELEPLLIKALARDKQLLENTEIPVITVSGTFREDVKQWFGLPHNDLLPDIVFSRAHYSMALGAVLTAWCDKMSPQKAWIFDPTNYVTNDQWKKIQLTEFIGKTLARNPFLKLVKDFIDQFGRNKLPILASITPPLLYVVKDIKKPILSFHIASGNILAEQGKKVIQVITDPHVREDYLNHADSSQMYFCVFDERTKTEFLEKATVKGIAANPDRVIVTGPPVDPRVIEAQKHKKVWSKGPLRLCITTGGLGTNKDEIEQLLNQLLPELRRRDSAYQLLIYTGTQLDIYEMVKEMAKRERVRISPLEEEKADFRVIYHPQIVDANELLIAHGFPWAHGFLSKPSGDMAYDAAASGSFLLTLKEWGVWEHNIREVFEQKDISRPVVPNNIVKQLQALSSPHRDQPSWIEQAMEKAAHLEPLFLHGNEKIIATVKKIGR